MVGLSGGCYGSLGEVVVVCESYADEGECHGFFLLRGMRVMFWQVWQVVEVWGSRFWCVRVWLLYPGMRGVSHFLHMPRRMSVGRWVLVRWAMRFMSWMYLLAWGGSCFMVSVAWL